MLEGFILEVCHFHVLIHSVSEFINFLYEIVRVIRKCVTLGDFCILLKSSGIERNKNQIRVTQFPLHSLHKQKF